MTQPKFSYEWGNPERVAEIHEMQAQAGCHDCIHKLILWDVPVCEKQPGMAGARMRKCDFFQGRIFND